MYKHLYASRFLSCIVVSPFPATLYLMHRPRMLPQARIRQGILCSASCSCFCYFAHLPNETKMRPDSICACARPNGGCILYIHCTIFQHCFSKTEMLAMVFAIIAVQLYTIGSSESKKERLLLAPATAIATAPTTVAISFFTGWHVTVVNNLHYLI